MMISKPAPHWRWQPTTPVFILVAALVNAVLYHFPLYSFAVAHLDFRSVSALLPLLTLFVAATAGTALLFGAVSLASERVIKPLFMVIAVGNSIALYFVQVYGVVLDKTMMGNVFNTNTAEASELFHPALLLYVLLLGVAPCWLLSRMTVRRSPFPRRLAFVGLMIAIIAVWGYANAASWLWVGKHARRLGGMTMPWSYVINGPRRLAELATPREQKLLPAATLVPGRKAVVILMIGEAARAEDFSLYGYPRPTNPVLQTAGVTALPHAHSCSTYTTASLVCILSHLGSKDTSSEPLTSYLQRNGVDVIWRRNNWGEPRMTVQTFEKSGQLRAGCKGDGCNYDEVLLQGLDERIRASTKDRVFVVLHMAGSHGPAYYSKYPPRFERFKPVCKSVELQHCTHEELVNAYDNSIVYTDYVIGRAIQLLKGFDRTPTALIYVSDHGESLGEYGLYLHSTPYSIAPAVQKDIPFIVWTSNAFKREKGISRAQLAATSTHSQANVFHSVMGAFDMRSAVYRSDLDIFSGGVAGP